MKAIYKSLIVISLTALLIFGLCACEFDESAGNLQGGDLLNSERISEIKNEVLKTEETTSEADNEETSHVESSPTEETSESEEKSDTENESDSKNDSGSSLSDKDSETESEVKIGDTVYWTESGSVWHLYRDCGHLKNSQNVLFGTVNEAEEAGKEHVCSTCNKKAGKE
jgi:hypothetical protein